MIARIYRYQKCVNICLQTFISLSLKVVYTWKYIYITPKKKKTFYSYYSYVKVFRKYIIIEKSINSLCFTCKTDIITDGGAFWRFAIFFDSSATERARRGGDRNSSFLSHSHYQTCQNAGRQHRGPSLFPLLTPPPSG